MGADPGGDGDGDGDGGGGGAEAVAVAAALQDEQIETALARSPAERREAIVRAVAAQLSHSGPSPPPQQLHEYEHVPPGLAERIVRPAEAEQEHRHEIVTLAVRREARRKEPVRRSAWRPWRPCWRSARTWPFRVIPTSPRASRSA